jgi:hypothetical protein
MCLWESFLYHIEKYPRQEFSRVLLPKNVISRAVSSVTVCHLRSAWWISDEVISFRSLRTYDTAVGHVDLMPDAMNLPSTLYEESMRRPTNQQATPSCHIRLCASMPHPPAADGTTMHGKGGVGFKDWVCCDLMLPSSIFTLDEYKVQGYFAACKANSHAAKRSTQFITLAYQHNIKSSPSILFSSSNIVDTTKRQVDGTCEALI